MTNEMTTAIGLALDGVQADPEIMAALLGAKLDLSQNIPDPEPVILQNDTVMLTKGNFSAVVGAAKSRKTFFVTAVAGAYLCPDEYLGMHAPKDAGNVLYIDTEMATGHVGRVAKRIHRIAGLDPKENSPKLNVLCLREYAPEQRKSIFELAIEYYKPQFVILDGVADLVDDVNDPGASSEVVTLLLRLTKEKDIHIMTIVHTNPGGDKPRGHLGSEVMRKAEGLYIVKSGGDNSTVQVERCRDIAVNDFAFFVDSTGLPQLTEIQKTTPKGEKLMDLFKEIVPLPNTISYADLVAKVMGVSNVKDRMAKRKISDALNKGVIEKNNADMYHLKQATDETQLPF